MGLETKIALSLVVAAMLMTLSTSISAATFMNDELKKMLNDEIEPRCAEISKRGKEAECKKLVSTIYIYMYLKYATQPSGQRMPGYTCTLIGDLIECDQR